jgi:hypothetical protein
VTTNGESILDLAMGPNDANAATIRDYLVKLLAELWTWGESFSGKRPFGNSGWEYDLYDALGRAGLIRITYDDDGYIDDVDTGAADKLIATAIEALRTATERKPS